MRSRRYYSVAGSSLLLLTIGCPSQDAKRDARRAEPASQVGELVSGDAAQTGGVHDSTGVPEHPGTDMFPAAADGGDEAGVPGPSLKGKDGCRRNQMRFEGKCVFKDRVSKILDRREARVLSKVKKANKPQQVVEATYELIEQQTQQMGKVEDDLDEIIEQLEWERAESVEKAENVEKAAKGAP